MFSGVSFGLLVFGGTFLLQIKLRFQSIAFLLLSIKTEMRNDRILPHSHWEINPFNKHNNCKPMINVRLEVNPFAGLNAVHILIEKLACSHNVCQLFKLNLLLV